MRGSVLQIKQWGGESWVRENIIFLVLCDWSIVKAILALPHAPSLTLLYSDFQIESKAKQRTLHPRLRNAQYMIMVTVLAELASTLF